MLVEYLLLLRPYRRLLPLLQLLLVVVLLL
jgi:hypothetical protein